MGLNSIQNEKENLNISPTTLYQINNNLGNSLEPTGIKKKDILNKTPFKHLLRLVIDKWNLMKLRMFFMAKDTIIQTNLYLKEWEKISTNSPSDREQISKIYRELNRLENSSRNKRKFKKIQIN